MASGTSRSWAAANTGSWSGWPSGAARWVNGATNPAGTVAHGPLQLRAAAAGSPSDRWAVGTSRPAPSEHHSQIHQL